jgi:hypothetical protein
VEVRPKQHDEPSTNEGKLTLRPRASWDQRGIVGQLGRQDKIERGETSQRASSPACKHELLVRAWDTRTQLAQGMFEWIEVFYNQQRAHSTLGRLAPSPTQTTRPGTRGMTIVTPNPCGKADSRSGRC